MKKLAALVLFSLSTVIASQPAQSAAGDYHVTQTIAVGGDDGWDYVAVDSAARHVFVSHGTHVVVLDADSGKVVGDIPDTQGVHGIAIASDAGRGFTSNGRANTVTVFDLKTFKTQGTVKTGTNPDAIVYDPATNRIFTMNGRSQDTTAVNVADSTVAGTLALGGKPEFAVADGKGSIWVNVEDKSELVRFDSKTLKHFESLADGSLSGTFRTRRRLEVTTPFCGLRQQADGGHQRRRWESRRHGSHRRRRRCQRLRSRNQSSVRLDRRRKPHGRSRR